MFWTSLLPINVQNITLTNPGFTSVINSSLYVSLAGGGFGPVPKLDSVVKIDVANANADQTVAKFPGAMDWPNAIMSPTNRFSLTGGKLVPGRAPGGIWYSDEKSDWKMLHTHEKGGKSKD